ncbi:hypothetical protein SLA2020_442120 [Shorea laevis]
MCIEALNLNVKNLEKGIPSMECQVLWRKLLCSHGDFILEPLIVNSMIELPFTLKELIDLTFDGLESGSRPIQSSEGSGGVYFI